MRAKTKKVKDALAGLPRLWVRTWPNGVCLVGQEGVQSEERRQAALTALKKAGIAGRAIGERGTSGEYGIEIDD
ncbi:hypothetical protein [Bordetella flabilis]|uniref:hypothetical protein n=1 Tax=Bordetella flabilis TaxID=463014 RepID=UPI000B0DAD70|nr:hypothetical protein [Bordetella flabilis]